MNLLRAARGWLAGIAFAAAIASICFTIPSVAHAQATISTGGIQGTILDPKGATVPAAKVTIISKATGQQATPTVSDNGEYNAGSLTPGEYSVRVEAAGFKTVEKKMVVQVGLVTTGNITLEIGESTTVVTVEASGVNVNTEQAIVSGVLTTEQIENLPINGRNFLDLAQLEPGVQIQDGQNFDPTKVGYSSISFGGRFGRTARINVDGVDISDETVGTTTTNIPASALQEFQLSQSSLDLSNDITSSGAVNVVTRAGTNDFHGQAFGLLRDDGTAAALPRPAPSTANPNPPAPSFERNQVGGNFGGPVIKDKLFFFMDAEHTIQHLFAPLALSPPFAAIGTGYNSPFKENDLLGKVDYVATQNLKFFYRFTYFNNYAVSEFQTVGLNPYLNKDYTRTHLVGADWNRGSYTNSFRFEYLKFQNQILDATLTSGLPFSTLGASLSVGSFNAGPSTLAPQTTPQSDRDFKYDGSKVWRNHIFRYGGSINHIQGGGFAKFFSINPLLINNGTPPGGGLDPTNPLNYTVQTAIIGNGLGFSTEKPAFGFPFGGLGPDNRIGFYFGDSWKAMPNLTITAGLRYDRDTGRTDSDLNDPNFASVVNSFFPGFGNRVKQPNLNFAPQLGVAWDPFKSGKTVIRAGAGFYFENVIYNSVLFDRPLRIPSGGFLAFPAACFQGAPIPVSFGDGTTHQLAAGVCGGAIGTSTPAIVAFQHAYQASFPANAILPNPGYLPTLLQGGTSAIPNGFFGPDYRSPRALQMNIGFQRQLWKGGVFSADFVRNVGTHYELGYDVNHVGDVRFFNPAAVPGAIARTLNACGAGFTLAQALTACPGIHPAMNGNPVGPVTIADFAARGLGTPSDAGVSICDAAAELAVGDITNANQAFPCAFSGINPNSPSFPVQEPIGRSTYDGLQIKYTQNVAHPMRGMKNLNLQVSYSLSSFKDDGGQVGTGTQVAANDQDFVDNALDYANPAHFFGPGSLDRRNQLSFGGIVETPGNFRIGFVGHFYSPLPATLYSFEAGAAGEIFRTDYDGSGTIEVSQASSPLPGTTIGAFGRSISGVSSLTDFLNNYNTTIANQPTPAGQQLVSGGFFTIAQLQSLGGVAPSFKLPPIGEVSTYGLRAFDFKFSWVHRFKERMTIEPSVSLYNAFNLANFDLPQTMISGILNAQAGSLNGTTYPNQSAQRVGVGTGVFSLGAPRVFEWGMKVTF
jgi:Carboxypeptidase regulatory-like domain